MNKEMVHACGILPLLPEGDNRIAVAARNGLAVTAVCYENTLFLRSGADTAEIPLLRCEDDLPAECTLAAVPKELYPILEQLHANYPQTAWIFVGRWDETQLANCMKDPNVCAVCDTGAVAVPREKFAQWCAQCRSIALGYSFAHMGINSADEIECFITVEKLKNAFAFRSYDIGSSVMVAGPFEVVKTAGRGTHGHIGIETASVARAMEDLSSRGFALDPDSVQRMPNGQIQSVYLQSEIGGFALHLLQKR